MEAATSLAWIALVIMWALSQAPPRVPKPSMIKSETPGQCAPGSSIGVDARQEYPESGLSDTPLGTQGHGQTDESATCDIDVDGRLNLTNGVQLYELSSKADFRYTHLEN
ncbi:hypothetical protein DL767_005385 [Monosporascus sp. MG133]|nr:hypothetical protein DL767_005385 [Monosporascus sp. MG133]